MKRFALMAALGIAAGPSLAAQQMTTRQLLELPQPAPDTTIRYGADSLQFGELYRAKVTGKAPVVVLIHGGCWLAAYDRRHIRNLAAGIAAAGVSVWSLEYRRIGNPGGGWPGSFEDVAAGVDFVRQLAVPFGIDTGRVAVAGHSAGGHFALWVAGRRKLPPGSPGATAPLRIRGAVGLAAIPDLAGAERERVVECGDAISRLMGGTAAEFPDRYRLGSPSALIPLGVAQVLITGDGDRVVPPRLSTAYLERAKLAGDPVRLVMVPGAGHFEVIAPSTPAGRETIAAIRQIVGLEGDSRH